MDTPEVRVPGRRSVAEIIQALLAGQLDIADVKLTEQVQIDEIDMRGDAPKLVRSRLYQDGVQVEVVNYP